MSEKLPITLVVITLNEEANLPRLLANLDCFEEILVVDSESTDRTRHIAESFGARIICRPFTTHVDQKNFAVDHARHRWVLCLDADERVPAPLLAEIKDLWPPPKGVAGFRFRRKTGYFGRWIRYSGWFPNWQLRLFDRDRGKFAGQNPHDRVEIKGRVISLQNPLEHFSYTDLTDQWRRMGRYAEIGCAEMVAKKRYFYFSLISIRPLLTFLRDFILYRGYRDGFRGFCLCVTKAFEVFYKYVLLYEKQLEKNPRHPL